MNYGQKTYWNCSSDEIQIIASGLTTISQCNCYLLFLKECFAGKVGKRVLIGEPKQMNGQPL
jgi:putative Holliday junction resolvase